MAWQREETKRCKRCGTYGWQWDGGDPFEAATFRCRGCEQLDALTVEVRAGKGNNYGVHMGLFPPEVNDDQ